ncbi:MAG: HlyD family efflux transporter periplasmic adaptor subunit [Bacteroidetes bacterium]|nr:MAG: HlyD family efflux transporter periplasmic adaptor subunit [Bacteroidota bacterium]
MMKRAFIIVGIVAAITALIVFNRMTSKNKIFNAYAEVKKGLFEITVTNTGELIAEKSIDIKGPEIAQSNDHGPGGRGDMHAMDLKIQDIIPEGTIVKEGDYIAQLDRTSYANTLKDALESLQKYQANVEMKILDTAVVLNNLRDDIKNQRYVVEEAEITLAQSKYEPPATVRQAEIALDKAKRSLEQKKKGYHLKVAQTLAEINHEKFHLSRGTRLVEDLQTFLAKFTITAPSSGMIIYKKDRNGTKRKTGSTVNPFDRVIATLPDLSTMISKVYVNEIEVSKVKPGEIVNITVDAFPEKAFKGSVTSVANIGEVLPNSDAKMFEVQIKVDGSDPDLRPSMTTGNKIIIKTFNDAVYIPSECVQASADSIPFVYEKNKTKQIVILGESNEKNVIVEHGLEPGTTIYLTPPEQPEKFRLAGENLISIIKVRK